MQTRWICDIVVVGLGPVAACGLFGGGLREVVRLERSQLRLQQQHCNAQNVSSCIDDYVDARTRRDGSGVWNAAASGRGWRFAYWHSLRRRVKSWIHGITRVRRNRVENQRTWSIFALLKTFRTTASNNEVDAAARNKMLMAFLRFVLLRWSVRWILRA